MKDCQNFDTVRHTFHEEQRLMARAAELTHKNFRTAKRHAYHTAKAFIEMQASDPNRLMEMIRDAVGTGPDPVNRFIEKTFAPLTSIGEDFAELITAIHEGMSEKEYLAKSPAAFLGSKRKPVKAEDGDTPLPPPPLDDMDGEQQAEHWRTRALAAERELKNLRSRVNELSRESAKLRRQNQKLHKLIKNANA